MKLWIQQMYTKETGFRPCLTEANTTQLKREHFKITASKMYSRGLLAFAMLCISTNFVMVSSECNPGKGQQEFDYEKFQGKWYASYQSKKMYEFYTHWIHEFTYKGDGKYDVILNSISQKTKKEGAHPGSFNNRGPGPADFQLTLTDLGEFDGPYNVISSDYTCFSVLQGCPQSATFNPLILVDFREEKPSKECKQKALAELDKAVKAAGKSEDYVAPDPTYPQ